VTVTSSSGANRRIAAQSLRLCVVAVGGAVFAGAELVSQVITWGRCGSVSSSMASSSAPVVAGRPGDEECLGYWLAVGRATH
jgi:hypothetical protein